MATYSDVVTDDQGYRRPIPGVAVYVYNQDGSLTPLIGTSNPVLTNELGQYSVTVADPGAVVNLEYRYAGVTKRLDSIIIGKPAQYVGDTGATGPANSTYPSIAKIRTQAAPTNLSAILIAPGMREIYGWTPDVAVTVDSVAAIGSDIDPTGSWRRIDGPLYAGNFGVVGDASSDANNQPIGTDDTVAAQAFLDLCASLQRIAYFGGLRVLISGPLYVHNGSMVFDRCSFTATGEGTGVVRGEPGVYVKGNGYTAITYSGILTDHRVTICGSGDAYVMNGKIIADTRPKVNGFQFGNPLGAARGTMILSRMQWTRATKLSGTGIRIVNAFDITDAGAMSTERCGNAEAFASSIEDGGNTTNESVFPYWQNEFSVGKAMYISPNLLACKFLRIHSERIDTLTTDQGQTIAAWVFGPAQYSTVRLNSRNMLGRAEFTVQYGDIRGLKPENVRVAVNSTGGIFTFHDAQFTQGVEAMTGSNGVVNFIGCSGYFHNVMPGWHIQGGTAIEINVGPCASGRFPTVRDMDVQALRPTDSTAAVALMSSRVEALRGGGWQEVRVTANSRAMLENGAQTFAQMKLVLDATSKIVGNVMMDSAGGRIAGRVEGDYNMTGLRGTLFADTAEITGSMNTSAPPESEAYLDGAADGVRTKNCRPSLEQSNGFSFTVAGWIREGGQYREDLAIRRPLPTGTTA